MRKNIFISLIYGFLSVSTIKAQIYVAFVPCMTSTIGNAAAKFSPAMEVGKQWDVFSLGLDIGKTNSSPVRGKDTTTYIEFRPNLNIFQVGRFTNTFTPGIGYVIGADAMMLEMTAGLEYACTESLHINMFFGQYSYSGMKSSSSVSFVGISIVKYFMPYKSRSSIINTQKQKS